MKILKILNQVARENTYILENDTAVLVIDPGSNSQKICETLKTINKPVCAILLTHAHYDHIMSIDIVREQFHHPDVYISENEAPWLSDPQYNLSGLDRHSDMKDVIIKPADHYFKYHTAYSLSDFNFQVVQTPGHSFGGVSFVFEDEELVFTGDALFKESVGRTDLPTSNFEDLMHGIKTNLFTLPDHFTVLPGHGMNSTIAHEKQYNPFFNQ